MKKIDIVLILGLISAIIFSNFTAFAKNYDDLRGSVVRLHILANSNSDEDQELKLKVRDAILNETQAMFSPNLSLYETEIIINDNLDEIQSIAQRVVKENGYDYKVNCELTHMEFDTRAYDDFTMPAGDYDALRITIGAAEGKNWWCVMYPPLCLPAATEKSKRFDFSEDIIEEAQKNQGITYDDKTPTEKIEETFPEEQQKILEEPQQYEVKFKCVEIFKDIKDKFSSWF